MVIAIVFLSFMLLGIMENANKGRELVSVDLKNPNRFKEK